MDCYRSEKDPKVGQNIHNVFTCRVSLCMCAAIIYVWSRLIEFSCVALSCFDLSRLAIFLDARMLVKPVAQGSSVLNVVGQETCA